MKTRLVCIECGLYVSYRMLHPVLVDERGRMYCGRGPLAWWRAIPHRTHPPVDHSAGGA